MRKLSALTGIVLLGLTCGARSVGFESRRFTPYFNMTLAQGGYMPTKGDFFTGANMNMSVGLLSKITDNHGIFSLYNLNFAGQAFRFPDTQEFASKSLSHNFNLEYRWQMFDWLRLRPGIAYSINYTRTAAGEIWGQGLYDSKTTGGQLSVDYLYKLWDKDGSVTFTFLYRDVAFPNYTDIIREFQGTDANTELAGGLKDQILTEYSFNLYWSKFFARFRVNSMDFKNEKVVEASGLYGNTKQKDSNFILSGGFEGKLWIFEVTPEVAYTLHKSNQNFLLFQSATDPSPKFAANYYDYNELRLSAPLFVNLTKKWAVMGGLDYQFRSYSDRAPRDGNNQFTDGKQKNNMVTFTGGFRKKMNEVSSVSLTLSSVVATSNNKFERYLPYNYSGQSVTLAYTLTY